MEKEEDNTGEDKSSGSSSEAPSLAERLGATVLSTPNHSNSVESHEINDVNVTQLLPVPVIADQLFISEVELETTQSNPCEGLQKDTSMFDEFVHNYDNPDAEGEVVADEDIVETSSPIPSRLPSPWISEEDDRMWISDGEGGWIC